MWTQSSNQASNQQSRLSYSQQLSSHDVAGVFAPPIADRSATRLGYRIVTDAVHLNSMQSGSQNSRIFGSLRRFGEKLETFEIKGDPNEGFTIEFTQTLGVEFEFPETGQLKNWNRVVKKGSWESAFEQLSQIHLAHRGKLKRLRDDVSIRRDVLEEDPEKANTLLSLIVSKTDSAVLLLNAAGEIDWLNQASCRVFATNPTASLNRSVFEMFFGSANQLDTERQSSLDDFRASFMAGHSFSCEYFRDSDGERSTWTAFQLTPVRDEDDVIGAGLRSVQM